MKKIFYLFALMFIIFINHSYGQVHVDPTPVPLPIPNPLPPPVFNPVPLPTPVPLSNPTLRPLLMPKNITLDNEKRMQPENTDLTTQKLLETEMSEFRKITKNLSDKAKKRASVTGTN